MVSATDSATRTISRGLLLALAAALTASAAGCARLQEFRQGTKPAFGTETAMRGGGDAKAEARSAYAERIARTQSEDRPGSEEAAPTKVASRPTRAERRHPANPPTEMKTSHSSDDASAPQISLMPPVGLTEGRRGFRPRTTPEPAPVREEHADDSASNDEPAPLALASTTAPALPSQPSTLQLDALISSSRKAVEALVSYQVKMTHQERVNGRLQPAEDVVLSVRRKPKAVRIEWREGKNKGREVLYAADARNGMMHVKMPDGLVPLPRLSIAPDSPLALRNSRHPITEAGFDTIIDGMEKDVKAARTASGDVSRIVYQGLDTPDGFDKPCHKVVRQTEAGETWLVYLDPDNHLPTLVQANDRGGDLLERYSFREPVFNPEELASAEAFDPDSRWGQPRGLLQRMARAQGDAPKDGYPH